MFKLISCMKVPLSSDMDNNLVPVRRRKNILGQFFSSYVACEKTDHVRDSTVKFEEKEFD